MKNDTEQQVALQVMKHRLEYEAYEDAVTIAEGNSYFLRVIEEDNKPLSYTMEWNPNRLNVKIHHGIVTEVCHFG